MDQRIDRVKFDVNFTDQEEARDLQDKFFSICRKGLDRALESVLDKYDLTISIENITLDLGQVSRRDLDNKLLDLMAEKFEEALISHLEDLQFQQSSEQFQLEALSLFLEKGLKHWSSVEELSLLELFREVLKRASGSLTRFMVNSRHKLTVVSRLIALIEGNDYAELIAKMRPAESSFILSFISEVKEVNSINPFSPSTSGKQLDNSLRQLVLLDLIKDYGSAFNRRMFIERNLQSLAREFNLSYEELLNHFERILSEEIPYSMTSTLPGLIHSISEQYHIQEVREDRTSTDHELMLASLIAINDPLHQLLKDGFAEIIQEYSGEVKSYLMKYTRTSDQVTSLVGKLKDAELELLIQVVEPDEHEYIQTYISGAKGIAHNQIEFRSDQAMHAQIYQVVLGYLLIDRGSRFNQKAFLRYQLLGMSQATGVSYLLVLRLLRESLALLGISNMGTVMISFLEEFLFEEETKVIDENLSDDIEVEEGELVRQYLQTGTLPVHLRSKLKSSITQSIQQVLSKDQARSDLFEFLKTEKEKVLMIMVDLKPTEFESIIRIILMEHWNLVMAQADKFIDQLRKLERQVVYPVAYRKVAFQLLFSPSLKVGQVSHPAASAIHATEVSDVLVYQLQEQLSLPRIMEHPDYVNTLEFHGNRETSFANSRKRILAALDDFKIDITEHQKEAIRSAFHKIQESDFETFTLLDHLKQEEVEYLFLTLEKQHFQKLIEQLSVGKWQLLKKSLQLIVKGVSMQQKEVAEFFAVIFRQRHHSVKQVFRWFNEHFGTLNLPKYYQDQVEKQQQKMQAKLELSEVDTDENPGLIKERNLLIDILLGHSVESDQEISVDTLFDQLFKKAPNALFKRLHELSFRPAAVERYVDKLSAASIEQWIKFETGASYQTFNVLTQQVEQFIVSVFKSNRSINIGHKRVLAIRLMLANRVGHYSVSFEQVLRFYMQEVSEHTAYKYQLVKKWLSQGLSRGYEEFSTWMDPNYLVVLEEEIKPPAPETQQVRGQDLDQLEETSEVLSNLKVPNAGLTLLWPFFQRLFAMLDYLNEENVFKSNVERSRAVRLLHYVCGFDWDEPEYHLTLNKILCGMPFSERMEPELEITAQELEISEQMLQGIIQNWQHLGATSVSGLQESFLRRDGFLEKEDENWTLKVEKKGIDVLIDHMPWSYASVILRWMPGAIYVDWR